MNTARMVERMNDRGLIYQYPVCDGHVYQGDEAVEGTCSSDHPGEKPSLNALLYKTLRYMVSRLLW